MAAILPIVTPCVLQCIAPTRGGKSQLIKRLLLNDCFQPAPDKIYVVYSYLQPMYEELLQKFGSKIQFLQGFSEQLMDQNFYDKSKNNLLIFDDGLTHFGADLVKIVSETSHHCNLSVLILQQSIFPPSRHAKTINGNCSHVILLSNPRDTNQITCFARQLFGSNARKFIEVYKAATAVPYGYVLINLSPHTPTELRVCNNLTGEDQQPFPVIYPVGPLIHSKFQRMPNFDLVALEDDEEF